MYITEKDLENELNQASDANVSVINAQKAEMLAKIAGKVFEINIQNSIFKSIQFPSLPRNWQFIMSKIDWPEKAMKNPNGSLFMDPQKIDQDDAQDIAMQCFNSNRFDGEKTGLKATLSNVAYQEPKNESQFNFQKTLVSLLLEDTPSQRGAEIPVRSIEDVNKNMFKTSTDVVKAITDYIVRTIDAVKPVVEMTGGSSGIRTFMKAVNTANAAAYDTVEDWLE